MSVKRFATIALTLMLTCAWGIFFSNVGRRSILQCQRSQATISCTLTETNLLVQPQVQPLPPLTAAIVDVQESTGRYRDSYRVVLVTAIEQIPLTDYSDHYNPQAKLSEQINQFLRDATRSQLLLKVNPFGDIWFLGLLLIPFSLKALEMIWSEVALIQQEHNQSIEGFYRNPKRK